MKVRFYLFVAAFTLTISNARAQRSQAYTQLGSLYHEFNRPLYGYIIDNIRDGLFPIIFSNSSTAAQEEVKHSLVCKDPAGFREMSASSWVSIVRNEFNNLCQARSEKETTYSYEDCVKSGSALLEEIERDLENKVVKVCVDANKTPHRYHDAHNTTFVKVNEQLEIFHIVANPD